MRRRRFVALASASALPVAGCIDSDWPQGESDGQQGVGEPYESSDGTTVTVQDVSVRKLVRSTSVGSATHVDVACLVDHQFAVVETEATDPDGRSIRTDVRLPLEVDGERYPRNDQHMYWAIPPGSYDRPGHPAIAVPITDATDAAALWLRDDGDPVRWMLSAGTVATFGRAPAFEIEAFDTPDAVRPGDPVDASFTVANTGDRDGRLIAEFGAGPISDHDEVVFDVPAGGDRTYTDSLNAGTPEDAAELRVTLERGCDRLHRTVPVRD